MFLYRRERSLREILQPLSRINRHQELVISTFRSSTSIALIAKCIPLFTIQAQASKQTTVHLFLWPSVDCKRKPPNMDSYTRRCRTNYAPLSQNHSKVGRTSTRFAPESSSLGLMIDLATRRDLSKQKNKYCKVGSMISKRIAYTYVHFTGYIRGLSEYTTGRASETRLHRKVASR